jgi:uncharacterized protein (TIGR00297 family)
MSLTLRAELPRKTMHIGMGGFALLLRWMTPWQAVLMAVAALVLNAFFLHRLTGRALLRPGERARGSSRGVIAYPAALLGVFLIFQSRLELAAGVWGLLAVGDGMATLCGLAVGGPRLPWNRAKRWSGFVAFVVFGTLASAFLIRWTQLSRGATALWPRIDVTWVGASFSDGGVVAGGGLGFLFASCLAAATVAAFAESIESRIDDNFLVPVSGALMLASATLIMPVQLSVIGPMLLSGFLWGLVVTVPFALFAYTTKSVDRSGALGGTLVGTSTYAFAGWPGFALLTLLVTVGVGATRFGHASKTVLGIAQEREGRRGAASAFANTGVAVVCGFLALATPFPDIFAVAMVAAFATALFDTTASEIGKVSGRRHHLVTTLRSVPAGTDGAVSLEGTGAGMIAALGMVVLAVLCGMVTLAGAFAAAVGAFVGAMIESLAGALMGERKGSDSEVLNVMNTVVGAAVAVAVFEAFF